MGQQDAVEYLRHFVEFMNRKERTAKVLNDKVPGLKTLLKMKIEERLECQQSKKVRYSVAEDIVLRIDVDLNLATNAKEVAEYQAKQSLKEKGKETEEDDDGDSVTKGDDGTGSTEEKTADG